MNRFLRFNCAVYGALIRAYPLALRNEFGADMLDAFAADLFNAWREERASAFLRIWQCAVWELATIAIPGRLANPALAGPAISIAVHMMLMGGAVAMAAAFHEGAPREVLHCVVNLRPHP